VRKPNPARSYRRSSSRSGGFTLGRDSFAPINAVAGIALTPEMCAVLDDHDRLGLSAEQRRRAIIGRFAPARRRV
jgi:hypothetical protein